MVVVALDGRSADSAAGADLVTLRNSSGAAVPARLIGPIIGDAPDEAPWHVVKNWRVDAGGEPIVSIAPASAPRTPDADGHAWGALGLPDGVTTRVRPDDDPVEVDALQLAHGSHGHRHGQQIWWLTVAPGDTVWVDGRRCTVIATDRRRRTLDIDSGGEAGTVAFDDVRIQETTT